ncbi:hypothetical protein AWB81_01857 [Caballeronia arationis]|uniref:hypothetical protein n=1 Tax=Caballeronia arationis TaxID=1777142 RepID=UPI00074C9BA2|nr:hypothetical protein [Caballeronia arationis]SAK59522.1 hypothetical protein AWB81_01857 [Caballeronia arationis]
MNYPIIQTLRLDPFPIASMIEAVVGDYLVKPAPGIYAKGKFDPVMHPSGVYYQQGRNERGDIGNFVVRTIADIQRGTEVRDLDGNVVVTPGQIPMLSNDPTLPTRGMAIIERLLIDTLSIYGDQRKRSARQDDFAQVAAVIHPDYRSDPEIANQILGMASPIRGQVRDFAGENRWVIHFLHREGFGLMVEKSIDFRIADWHRMKGCAYD